MNRPCVICDNAYGTRYVCPACRADPANVDWRNPSDEEWSGDVDVTVRLEALQGGKRKFNTDLAHRIVQLSLAVRPRRMRRRTANGHAAGGWEVALVPMTYREIASELECSFSYVKKVISRLRK